MSSPRVLRSGNLYPNLGLTNRNTRNQNNYLENIAQNEDNVDNKYIDNDLENMDQYEDEEEDQEQDNRVEGVERVVALNRTLYSGLSKDMHKVEGNREKMKRASMDRRTEEPKSQINWILFFFLFIVSLSFGFVVFDGKRFFANNSNENNLTKAMIQWQTFDKEFKSFELKFLEILPEMGRKVLKSAVKAVMTRNSISNSLMSSSPAVILLIASKDNPKLLECVKRDFINIINNAFNEKNSLKINGKQTDSRDIIEKFEQNFGFDKKHSIVIENVESIAPEDVISLHQFTDHQNAKYKDIVIVLTAIDYKNFELTKNATLLQMDSIATQLFQMKWKNVLKEEQSFALISRLTPSVVTIIGTTDNKIKC